LIQVAAVLSFALTPTIVQGQAHSLTEQVQQAKHGSGRVGKDGPMAKVGSGLIRLHYQSEKGLPKKGLESPQKSAFQISNGHVAVNAVANESETALQTDLEDLGLKNGAVEGRLVSGLLPIESIEPAASLSTLQGIHGAVGASGVGAVTSRGDRSLQSDEARPDLNVDGSGVKVCVISTSYNNSESTETTALDDIQSGDLPGTNNPNGYNTPVEVFDDSQTSNDEGRAMLQIIHDVAPGATLGFHTAFGGLANFAEAVDELSDPNQGDCDVIVDDFIYGFGGMLQDGVVAESVKEAVNEDGKIYVTFAGNAADRSYESEFRGSGQDISSLSCYPNKSGEMHDFDPGSSTDVRQRITLADGRSTNAISLQWSDPLLDANSDLDLFLLDAQADTLVESSERANPGGFAAESLFQYTNTTGSPQELDLVITLNSGEPPELMKWVGGLSSFERITIDEHHTHSGTSFGHRNVSEAITVGAAAWFNTPDVPDSVDVEPDDPPVLNEYSSKGGVPIIFNSEGDSLQNPPEFRDKPDVTAPDGTNNTFFGADVGLDSDDFPNFFGTSAAAPHAAGVVALMLEKAGGGRALTASEVKSSLQAGATDITERSGPSLGTSESDKTPIPDGTGEDIFSGAGLIQADGSSPLPVELASFDGTTTEGGARLTWQTVSETNNAGFEVQRRKAEEGWTQVGYVESRAQGGTTTEPTSYSYTIGDLPVGTHQFRLRQVDLDGTSTLTEPVILSIQMQEAVTFAAPTPNPVSSTATLSFAVKEQREATIRLFDTLGQQVATVYSGTPQAGEQQTAQVDVSSLASGTYFLQLSTDRRTQTRRLTVVR
jgi:hypothetical protein